MASDSQIEYTRKEIVRKKKVRLEKTALSLLSGMVAQEGWDNAGDEPLVEMAIKLAEEFIKQMDEKEIL